MSESRAVQSARTSAMLPRRCCTPASANVMRSFTLQVRHQSAVKSRKTVRPEARSADTCASLHGVHVRPYRSVKGPAGFRARVGATRAPRSTKNTARAAAAAVMAQRARRDRSSGARSACSSAFVATNAANAPTVSHASPISLVCRQNTQPSHATVPNIGTASTRFIVSIQAPGRGIRCISAGTNGNTTYGSASPAPMAVNTRKLSAAGRSTANASAAPMSGAVHGVATTTASTPLASDPQ